MRSWRLGSGSSPFVGSLADSLVPSVVLASASLAPVAGFVLASAVGLLAAAALSRGLPALSERPVPSEAIVLGEIALSGEIRPVAHAGLRLKEAAKLGFETAWLPKGIKGGEGLQLAEFANLRQLVDQVLGR